MTVKTSMMQVELLDCLSLCVSERERERERVGVNDLFESEGESVCVSERENTRMRALWCLP